MQLPWLVNLASSVDRWSVVEFRLCILWSLVRSPMGEIHCWWNVIRSKQLSSGSLCHTKVFAGVSGRGISIYNAYLNKNSLYCRQTVGRIGCELNRDWRVVGSVVSWSMIGRRQDRLHAGTWSAAGSAAGWSVIGRGRGRVWLQVWT